MDAGARGPPVACRYTRRTLPHCPPTTARTPEAHRAERDPRLPELPRPHEADELGGARAEVPPHALPGERGQCAGRELPPQRLHPVARAAEPQPAALAP